MKIVKKLPGVRHTEIRDYEIDHKNTALEVAEEGIVLLKNEGILPLKNNRPIALYGSGARNTIKGGTGSGDVNERENISIEQGLRECGFEIESTEWLDTYDKIREAARLEWKQKIWDSVDEKHLFIEQYFSMPYKNPEENLILPENDSRAETAIYVLSRISGEGSDRKCEPGDFLLSESEERNLRFLDYCRKNIILVLNTGGLIDLSITEQMKNIKAIVYFTQGGMEGGRAFANILTGKVTPSGKLTDTWGCNYDAWPASDSFGINNGNLQTEEYREGIFVGYRWFDAVGKGIRYPFGFGLSYTEFSIRTESIQVIEGKCRARVTVTNIHEKYSGKEVVQLYLIFSGNKGITREEKKLVGFQKTKLLKPGESQMLQIEFAITELSRFDEELHAYIVDSGKYGVAVGNSAENISVEAVLHVAETVKSRTLTPVMPLQRELRQLEFIPTEKNFDTSLAVLEISPEQIFVKKDSYTDWHKELVEQKSTELAEQMSVEQLILLVCGQTGGSESIAGAASESLPGAAGETVGVSVQGTYLPGVVLVDGPAGLRLSQHYQTDSAGMMYEQNIENAIEHGFFSCQTKKSGDVVDYYQYCTAFPIGTMVAQTWNLELAEALGRAVGEEMEEFGASLWLAPGMNIHRNPLCGRNFEYYSEDPLISGKMAAAVTKGVQKNSNAGTTIKHFAVNNQEDNRMGVDCIVSERALREIYLKGFQIAIEEANPRAIMSSYNKINGIHASNSKDLCTRIAREEWGFEGIIMTDWTTTDNGSESYLCIRAGNDLIMPGTLRDHHNIRQALSKGKLSEEMLRRCGKRIIKTILELS